jgi:hypothetical protein
LLRSGNHIKLLPNLFAFKRTKAPKHSLPSLELLEYSVSVSFPTSGLVKFQDENNNPKIREFTGKSWSWSKFVRQCSENVIRVFINNYHLLKGQTLVLRKKIGDRITEKKIEITGGAPFEGWFELA